MTTPEYQIRINPRVKRMQLKVSPWGRVEVVVARPMSEHRVAAFVVKHRGWIERTLAHYAACRDSDPALYQDKPAAVALPAIDRRWAVEYHFGKADICDQDQRLQVSAGDDAEGRRVLCQWLSDQAREVLPPWLTQVALETELSYSGVTIRGQKTRWGSCSSRGRINLNRNLLFLSAELVRYLMVHELCHTVHLNHSKRYWSLVQSRVSNYQELEEQLRRAYRYVPLWAYPGYD